MKAGIIFTGSGPLVILTSYDSFTDSKLVEKLESKGIKNICGLNCRWNCARSVRASTVRWCSKTWASQTTCGSWTSTTTLIF